MKDLIAFYSSRDQAERAKDDLIRSGFDHDDVKVYDHSGKQEGSFWQELKSAFGMADEQDQQVYAEATRRGAVAVGVSFDHDEGEPTSEQAIQILQRYSPLDLDAQMKQWRAEGWTGAAVAAPSAGSGAEESRDSYAGGQAVPASSSLRANEQQAIPVVQEELKVGKRAVANGGVRIHSRVTETPVQEQIGLREETVNVERRAVDRPVTAADNVFQDRTIEATATREEAVVSKEARVVEEVAISKEANERTETVRDTVRRTDVDVEKIDTDPQYAPAREFASTFFADDRYKGRDWNEIEPDAQRSFEKTRPGQWTQFKDAIRSRYNRGQSSTSSNKAGSI